MRLRAFVFEDDPGVRLLLWTILDRRGYDVQTYPDPSACPLSVLAECPCPPGTLCADIIISDVSMPATNGIDFVQSLLEKGCQRPHFALMSGSWSDRDLQRVARLRCKIFSKPFPIPELVEWLASVESTVAYDRALFHFKLLQRETVRAA